MPTTRTKTTIALIFLVSFIASFGMVWVATAVFERVPLSGVPLRRSADYSGAALLIFLLGAALGCWCRASWVFLTLLVLTIVLEIERFTSPRFWSNIAAASLAPIVVWIMMFAGGIILGRFVHRRTQGVG